MRTYQQYCALARTLDLVGDRWTLLIVRELAIGPCRYTDLRDGLPGIATNLLAERLRELQSAGVIKAEQAPPPVATTLYALTEWGAQLRPVIIALGRWGSRLMASGRGEDHFRSRWAALGMEAIYADADLSGLAPLDVLIDAGGDPVLLTVTDAGFTERPATSHTPADLALATDADTTVRLLGGHLDVDDLPPDARTKVSGSVEALRRFRALTERARAARARQPTGAVRPSPGRARSAVS